MGQSMVNSSRKWNAFMSFFSPTRKTLGERMKPGRQPTKYPAAALISRKLGDWFLPMAQDGWFAALLREHGHGTMQLLIGIKVIGRIASNGIPGYLPCVQKREVRMSFFLLGGRFSQIQLSFCHCSASHITISRQVARYNQLLPLKDLGMNLISSPFQ